MGKSLHHDEEAEKSKPMQIRRHKEVKQVQGEEGVQGGWTHAEGEVGWLAVVA